jgi:hypothetical protein
LGGVGAATVAKTYQRFAEKLANDARLKKEMRELESSLFHDDFLDRTWTSE